ncbi:MAG: STAS/SEC14 domain-containing protein [Gammaproteobacteria bacterium]|nr:STAS/SEC14 domain-containing protein [Gammaproteobacteria bacterium]
MITTENNTDYIQANVFGEMTLQDYQELEQAIDEELRISRRIKLLLDLTMMSGFTLDVAWEDIKFISNHAHDFQRIAIVTQNQWLSWAGWINGAFTDAEISIFADAEEALTWMESD